MNPLPNPERSPMPEQVVDRSPLRKVMRQLPPLTAGANHVQDRVDNPPPANRAGPPDPAGLGQQRFDQLPLLVRQIAGILSLHECGSVRVEKTHLQDGAVLFLSNSSNS